jgi:hypothetical protein
MITLANPASVTCAHAALRDSLLPKLIRGEIRVKDAEKFIGGTREHDHENHPPEATRCTARL